MATAQLAGTRHLILAGARPPVSFFAYPGQPSSLVPAGCGVHALAGRGEDGPGALAALADLVAAEAARTPSRPRGPDAGCRTAPSPPKRPSAVIGALLPEGAIVSDESNTSGLGLPARPRPAPRRTIGSR